MPSLEGKTLLDVGSRLGAVLYGAFYHSKERGSFLAILAATNIFGV